MRIRSALLLAFAWLLVGTLFISSCVAPPPGGPAGSSKQTQFSEDVMLGGKIYVDYACVQCHGIGGNGRELIPGSGPSLMSDDFKRTFPKDPKYDAAIADQIRNGIIAEGGRAASMPAWNGILSDEGINSIVAYIRAGLPDVGVTIPLAEKGEEVYIAFACVKCHGPLGTGGIPNKAATTPEHQVIPALGGASLKSRFANIDAVRAVVQNGRIVEGGKPGVVYMPAWGHIGTADQVQAVLDYIWTSQ